MICAVMCTASSREMLSMILNASLRRLMQTAKQIEFHQCPKKVKCGMVSVSVDCWEERKREDCDTINMTNISHHRIYVRHRRVLLRAVIYANHKT